MNTIADQISDLSDEDQQRFHAYIQKSLQRQWAEVKNRQEKEIDEEINKRKS